MKINLLPLILLCVDLCASSYLPQEATADHFQEYLSKSHRLLCHIWERRDVLLNIPYYWDVPEGRLDDHLALTLVVFIDAYTAHLRATRFVRII